MTHWNAETVILALRYAANVHNEQKVPGTPLPYLLHLGQVMTEIAAALQVEPAPDGELSILCAILHDTIEDTDVTRAEVAERFGEAVAAGVDALSKNPSMSKGEGMADSLRRIREQPQAVWKVKLADRITNLQPPPTHWNREKAMRYRAEAEQILEALRDSSPVLAQRLQAKIDNYGALLPQS